MTVQNRPPFPGWMFLGEDNDLVTFHHPPLGAKGLVACVTEEIARFVAKGYSGIRVIPVDDDVLMGACRWFYEKEGVQYLFVFEKVHSEIEVKAVPLDQLVGNGGASIVADGQHRLNLKDLRR